MKINTPTIPVNSLKRIKNFALATTIAAAGLVATNCTESKNVKVDESSLHAVMGPNVMMQDGVSFEVNSKIFLMQDGQLCVYDKKKGTWSERKDNKLNDLYSYQEDIFKAVADAKNEVDGKTVLSSEDIKYWRKNEKDFARTDGRIDYYDAGMTHITSRYIREYLPKKGISIDAYQKSYDLRHSTPKLNILYDQDKNSVVQASRDVENYKEHDFPFLHSK